MGYYLTIADQNLKAKKDISDELKKLFEENRIYLYWLKRLANSWGSGSDGE